MTAIEINGSDVLDIPLGKLITSVLKPLISIIGTEFTVDEVKNGSRIGITTRTTCQYSC